MRLIFLCKRRPQGRDLLSRPYGRFFHLPRLLAQAGHQVVLFLLSHRQDPPLSIRRDGIEWVSESLLPFGPGRYLRRIRRAVEDLRPDWVVGFSDTYYGILAVQLGSRYGIGSAVDAYDNYESYIPWFKPLHRLWRQALARATTVTAAGPQLQQLLQASRPGRPVHVVPMAADPQEFAPMDRETCRRRLDLPLGLPLIGYCGSIYRNRGIQLLFDAYGELRSKKGHVRLILSGRRGRGVRLPPDARWLGYIPDDKVPYLLNAMNVLVVVNQLSSFGRYSYPTKLYEAMSCRIPVVATATEPAQWILGHRSQFLSSTDQPSEMAEKILRLLPVERTDFGPLSTWEDSCRVFANALQHRA